MNIKMFYEDFTLLCFNLTFFYYKMYLKENHKGLLHI